MKDLIKKLQEEYVGVRHCQDYYGYLATLEQSDEQQLLRCILSYYLRPENVRTPFHPYLIFEGKRSAAPEDLTDDDVQLLESVYQDVTDNELKARFADILWLRKKGKGITYALDAVAAYIESAKDLRMKSWTYSIENIERALRLSLSLGKGGVKSLKIVTTYICEILEKYDLNEERYFPLKLIELLWEIDNADRGLCISVLEDCVAFFTNSKDVRVLNDYLDALAAWYERDEQQDRAREKRVAAAENCLSLYPPDAAAMLKAHAVQEAIERYRRIADSQERRGELHKMLLDVQKKVPAEMKQVSSKSVDISSLVEKAIEKVSGKSKREALLDLCFVALPLNINRTFNLVEKQAGQFIHTSLFGHTTINSEGKRIAYTPGLVGNTLPREEKLYPNLVRHMQISWGISVQGAIIPAIDQIMLEHYIGPADLKEFVINNHLVRNGHESLVLQGLLFGFEGKWDLAIQILAIEFEDSLRYLLEARGILTSNIQSDFTQEERGTTYFFDNHSKELQDIFGKNIFYQLKALLIKDKQGHGANLRNLVAHGLMTTDAFFSSSCVYFWWLVFRLLATPVIVFESKNKRSVKKTAD